MTAPHKTAWDDIFEKRKHQLSRECSLRLQHHDFDSFQRKIDDLRIIYAKRGASTWFKKLIPSLEHVKSFTQAISSMTQSQQIATLIWGSLQCVIECICRFSNAVQSILDLVGDLNGVLPLFARSLGLYPDRMSLHWPLRDLFNGYMDSCVTIIKHLQRHPLKNILRSLVSSTLESSLRHATKEVEKQTNRFFREVETIDREATAERDLEHARLLGAAMLPKTGSGHKSTSNNFIATNLAIRNVSFVGRTKTLAEIHKFFTNDSKLTAPQPCCCVINGLGGQGKSQTALEFAHRYRNDFEAAFWANAETEQTLLRSYADIATRLQQCGEIAEDMSLAHPETGLQRSVEKARDWLDNTSRKWLLILDNLESDKSLTAYIPANIKGRGAILITTQKGHLAPITSSYRRLALKSLTTDSGAALLFKVLERDPRDGHENSIAHEMSKWVDGLPLAITTIGGFIKYSSSTPDEVFESLKRSSKVWESSGEGTVLNYNKTLRTVFDHALSELNENSRHFINLMAFLDPTVVPQEMLTRSHSMPSLHFLSDVDEFLEMIYHLGLRQLIGRTDSTSGPCLYIHRSLQLNVLASLKDDPDPTKRQRIFEEAFTLVRQVLPAASKLQISEAAIWPQYSRYVPQVISLRQNSLWPDPPLGLGLPFARMLSDVGTFLWNTGHFRDCEAAMDTAKNIISAQGPELRNSIESEELLSDIYLITGILADCVGVSKRKESMDHRQKLLQLRQKAHTVIPAADVSVDDEIRLWNAWGDLGCAHLQREEFEVAATIFEKMYLQYQKWGSEDEYPFEYSKYFHHMAYVLMAKGDNVEAIRFAKKAADLEEKHMGELDSTVLIARYDLASLLFNCGRLAESLNKHQEVLVDRKRLCGEGSQFTLESHEACGIILCLSKKYVEAQLNFKSCLASRYRASWTQEGIARAQFWHSRVLEGLGDLKGAQDEVQAARNTRDRCLRAYPDFLTEDPNNEAAVFDQMLPIWILQTTGKLQEGGRKPPSTLSPQMSNIVPFGN